MITIYYTGKDNKIGGWKERLDNLVFKYKIIEQDTDISPLLLDGEKQVEGVLAIEDYLDALEQFVKGWYEDRCDRYDFDPESPLKIRL